MRSSAGKKNVFFKKKHQTACVFAILSLQSSSEPHLGISILLRLWIYSDILSGILSRLRPSRAHCAPELAVVIRQDPRDFIQFCHCNYIIDYNCNLHKQNQTCRWSSRSWKELTVGCSSSAVANERNDNAIISIISLSDSSGFQ